MPKDTRTTEAVANDTDGIAAEKRTPVTPQVGSTFAQTVQLQSGQTKAIVAQCIKTRKSDPDA